MLNTVRSDVLLDPDAWRSFTRCFDQDPDRFAHIPGLVDPEPLLASVLRATAEFRRHDHSSNPRLRVFSDNQLDYPAIERFCYDTPPTADVFEFLDTQVAAPACIGMNELESWDPALREVAAAEFIPGLAPYLRRTASRADWYAFLTTGGWTSFGLHNDSEPSLVMNLGPSDREVWVWDPQALGGLDRGRRTSLNFQHLLPTATHHLVLAPGDFAAIPANWFHVFRSSGRSTLIGIAPYPRDVPMEICDYLRRRGVDPLQWFGGSDSAESAGRRITAVRRHVDLMVESAVFSTAPVRATPLDSDTPLAQALRALSPLIVVELPTLLLANGSPIQVPSAVGAETVAAWLRDTPTFSPTDFTERFPELPAVNGVPETLLRLAQAGALAAAADR